MLGALLEGAASLPCTPPSRGRAGTAGTGQGKGAWSSGNTDPAWGWLLGPGTRWLSLLRMETLGTRLANSCCTGLMLGKRTVLPVSPPWAHPILPVETEAPGAQSQQGLPSLPLTQVGNVGIWDQPHPLPSCHLRPLTGKHPINP